MLIIGIFPTEYFIGLEPLRFLFIWVIISEETTGFLSRFIQTIKHWWSYFLIWIVDALWLAYYYKSGAYISYGVTATRHALSIKALLLTFGDAFWKAGFYVWVQVLVLTCAIHHRTNHYPNFCSYCLILFIYCALHFES